MSNIVKVIEVQEKTILFECPLSQLDDAYLFAEKMEALGIDVEIDSPSTPASLLSSLKASKSDLDNLKDVISEEIHSHNDCENCD